MTDEKQGRATPATPFATPAGWRIDWSNEGLFITDDLHDCEMALKKGWKIEALYTAPPEPPADALREAASALVAKLDACLPYINTMHIMEANRGIVYNGPTLHKELGELRAALAAERPKAEPPAPTWWSAGIEAAAKWVEQHLNDYDSEHGSTDPETGTREYPGKGAGEEYVYELHEIVEGIRALAAAEPDGILFDALGAPRVRYVRITLDGSHMILTPAEAGAYLAEAKAGGDGCAYLTRDVFLSEREAEDLPEFDGF